MSKFDDQMEIYLAEVKKHGFKLKKDLLTAVAKSLGPSIYRANSSKVACSKKDERDTIKKNYLIKKLGLKDGPKLDEAIIETCKEMGSSNRNKYRPIFYALLAKRVRKAAFYK